MAILKQILDGSVLSSARLLQSRDFYSPSGATMSPQLAFETWTQRIAMRTELNSAREIAGLADAELAALEAEFLRSQTRQREPWIRSAVLAGALLLTLGAAGLSWQALAGLGAELSQVVRAISVASLLLALLPSAAALIAAFSTLHLEVSYGTLGLMVGQLNEQHPWLYKAASLTGNETAEDYRSRTLASRGSLRGADYVILRELMRAQELADQARPASAVADHLQRLSMREPEPVGTASGSEPRLVQIVGMTGARKRRNGLDL
ncbi:MAG: hypothetical protein ABI520_15530 [Caldimonas sp.]